MNCYRCKIRPRRPDMSCCDACNRDKAKLYRQNNHKVVLFKQRAHRLDIKSEKRAIVEEIKQQPCADCGRRFPSVAMDFDHVRGEKKTEIAVLVNNAYGIETLREELAKCELVCACCHRVRTAVRSLMAGPNLRVQES